MSKQNLSYEQAKLRVAQLRAFYFHAGLWFFVSLGLLALNLLTSGYPWALFPILGWGIFGLGAHGIATFGLGPINILGDKWEERKLRELMGDDAPKAKNDQTTED